MEVTSIHDRELVSDLKSKVGEERKLIVLILELLQEVARRNLHLRMGYGSLLRFCVEELGYSEAAAYRRISALRLSHDVPQIKQALQDGDLSLQVAAQAQTFFNQERKHNHKTYTREQKSALVQQLQGKSAREAEKILIAKSPDLPRPERSRQLTPSARQVTLTVTEQLDRKLKNLRYQFSHKNPNPSLSELIEMMADKIQGDLNQKDLRLRKRLEKPATPAVGEAARHLRPPTAKGTNPRYISAAKRFHIRMRDGGVCSFRDPLTGRQCGSRHQLEIDHLQPVAFGGDHDIDNLQLLCRLHNKMRAQAAGIWRPKTASVREKNGR